MSLLDITHAGMQDMEIYEKRRIITSAMAKAKIIENKSILLLIIFLCILGVITPLLMWLKTGFVLSASIVFFAVILIAPFIINKVAKPLYLPFIAEVVEDQDSILGSAEDRKAEKKKRNYMLVTYTIIFLVFNFLMITST